MKFRPCIDLHQGQVKQIIGSTLSDIFPTELKINFATSRSASYYAEMYQRDGLSGGHVIMLGPGNEEAARAALSAYPGGLQIGGGITAQNACFWLDQGAQGVIVTTYVFKGGMVFSERLDELSQLVGKDRLIVDLSCRKKGNDYYVVTDRWQKFTDVVISAETLAFFASYCVEFLVHAADVEGKCSGVAVDLIERLGEWAPIPTTYAGGIRNLEDLYLVRDAGQGRLDATVGSSLDIFGGTGITYQEALAFHRQEEKREG